MFHILSGAFRGIDGLKAAIVSDQWSNFFVGFHNDGTMAHNDQPDKWFS